MESSTSAASLSKTNKPVAPFAILNDRPILSTELHAEQLLANYTNEQILENLRQRQSVFFCTCGAVFRDRALFYMHRSSHAAGDAHKCSFCGYVAPNWYDFQAHFFVHKSTSQ